MGEHLAHTAREGTKKSCLELKLGRFPLSGLAGPTVWFFNGTYEFAELLLARMSLLMDQNHLILPLRSAKAREFGELWQENCTRALDLSM